MCYLQSLLITKIKIQYLLLLSFVIKMKCVPLFWPHSENTTKVVPSIFVQHIYPCVLCIPSYICGWFPAKRSMKCKQSREINWGDRPSPFSPWFRHKAAGSVLISDLESSPVNKSDNWGGCQTNWIAVRLRPCALLKGTRVFDNDMHVFGSSYADYWSETRGDTDL